MISGDRRKQRRAEAKGDVAAQTSDFNIWTTKRASPGKKRGKTKILVVSGNFILRGRKRRRLNSYVYLVRTYLVQLTYRASLNHLIF